MLDLPPSFISRKEKQMLELNPSCRNIPQDLVERYRAVDTSSIGHLTTEGYIRNIKAQTQCCRLLGHVVTVTLHGTDGSALYHALINSRPGDVLVISMPDHAEYACWGELRTIAAMIKGVAGIVTDACVTDIRALQDMAFPVFAKGKSSVTTQKSDLGGKINTLAVIDGQEIHPGDMVIGDEDGLFILSPDQSARLIDPVLEKQQQDERKRLELLAKLSASRK
ncbi:RraA family protein [Thalassospira xianhensis]|uniref:RraA family protein n=1 Tax=Thalassospira xianhensis TaxID=478503 RepID=UPI0011BFE035|nr:RraA family protein [Thalassospira xianhensis]